jgi:mono/diheme cytochrome c family protein
MQKISIAFILISTAFIFQYCSSSKKAHAAKFTVTYENSVSTIIQGSCAPCHIAGKGNKKPLNNYTAAGSTIDEIIARIQKNPGERGFMPMMHPKLADSTINLFVQWKTSGLKEK